MQGPMFTPLRRSISCVIFVAALASATTAFAQDKDADRKAAAKEHYQRGTSYYDLGRYQDAIKEFEAAYHLKNDPAFLYNLAQSYRLAGDAENALRLYRTYLRYVPKPANRAEIDDRIKQLEQQLANKGTGTTTPPGGGGTAPPPIGNGTTPPPPGGGTTPPPPAGGVGTLPPPGGGATTPPPGGPGTITPPPGGPGITPPPPGAGPTGSGAPPSDGTSPPGFPPIGSPPPVSTRGRTMKTAGMITAGAGGLLLLIGIVQGLRAESASKTLEDAAKNGDVFDPAVEKRGVSAERWEAVTVITGLLAIGGGAALWYLGRKQEIENTTSYRISLTPVMSPNGGGAWLRVRF
jgi:tetratricopeptide (TPR) repeat protein